MSMRSVLAAGLGIALVLAAGCAQSDALGEDDSGSTITLAVGEQVTIELPSNITTGYSWLVADDGGLEQIGEPEYNAPETDAVGAGGTQRFVFEAIEAGSGDLRLEYAQPWESVQPAETWSVTVEVE